MITFKLSQCVSRITVSKKAIRKEPAFTIIRDCPQAVVIQGK